MPQSLMQRIFQNRPKVSSTLREILQIPKTAKKYPARRRRNSRTTTRYVKGVANGQFFRVKLPPKESILPNIRKLPQANPIPKPFKPTLPPGVAKGETSQSTNRVYQWLKTNLPILCLNFGSMCILVGFSRSDVVELRGLAMTGQLMFVVYNLGQKTILWPSIAWSTLFASVNGVKIFEILHERTAEVHMNEEQEDLFVEHFMSHGITPKQFERIEQKASKFDIKKGGFLIRKDEKLDHVFLVTHGSTTAHILGRHLTAASTNRKTKGDQKVGGDSGAWIGEMAFLESFARVNEPNQDTKKLLSLYTIVADEDCTVLSWSHDDLTTLMESSTDLRAALTRAMTSAVVGKVVNLTVSRKDGIPTNWSNWLSDWKHNDGASVRVNK